MPACNEPPPHARPVRPERAGHPGETDRDGAGDPTAVHGIRSVAGERGVAAVARTLSLQARLSNWLAVGVMLLVGGGLLVWYYAHQAGRGERLRQDRRRAQPALTAEMALPPLGPIDPPWVGAGQPGRVIETGAVSAALPTAAGASATTAHVPAVRPGAAPVLLPVALRAAGAQRRRAPAVPHMRPGARDRRLQAQVFVSAGTASAIAPAASPSEAVPVQVSPAQVAPFVPAVQRPGSEQLPPPLPPEPAGSDAGLSAPLAVPVSARVLPRQSLILAKGTSIDCTLETAIDSTLPGLTRCLTATDTFGADGRVVLLERGTELVGQTQGQVQQGAARVFVLWSEARTPRGVIVPLESPGADELGRAGLPGRVQRHFWERFGAAILVSTLDGAVQAAVQSTSHGNGTVIYSPGASEDVMTEVLRHTVSIPPTVRKANGDRIQVLVARDVDFSDVYELRRVSGLR
jgi:type IV secretion system protein VirB10